MEPVFGHIAVLPGNNPAPRARCCPLPLAPRPWHTEVLWGRGMAQLEQSPSSPGFFPFQSPEGIGGSGGHLARRPEQQSRDSKGQTGGPVAVISPSLRAVHGTCTLGAGEGWQARVGAVPSGC